MPEVKPKEKQGDYVSRCVAFVMKHEGLSQSQAVAKCYGMYKQHKQNHKTKGCTDCEPTWADFEKDFEFPGDIYISLE